MSDVRKWLFEREQERDRARPVKEPIIRRVPRVGVIDRAPALPQCCTREGSTYVIMGADKIKIGKSIHVPERVRDIQAMSPVPIAIIAVARGVDLERRLHDECDAHWSHGEWFDLSAWGVIGDLFGKAVCASCVLASHATNHSGRWLTDLKQHGRVIEIARPKRETPPPRPRVVLEPKDGGRIPLTDRQRALFEFIQGEVKHTGRMPTMRVIGERFGIASTNGVNDHLKAMTKKGWLTATVVPSDYAEATGT